MQGELGLSDLSRYVPFVEAVVSKCAHLGYSAAVHSLRDCPHPCVVHFCSFSARASASQQLGALNPGLCGLGVIVLEHFCG